MSLIGVWRDRKQNSLRPVRPPQLWKLVAAGVIVAILIWRLSRLV